MKVISLEDKGKESVISIIIPVYNVALYMREAIESVLNQTYQNLEVILIDDGSTDESGTICDEYTFDRRVIVIHQTHHGPGNARNIGLDIATGTFIAFLDADDAYHSDFVRLMLETIGEADIAVCQFSRNRLTPKSKDQAILKAEEGCFNRKKALQDLIEGHVGFMVWNKLYHRKLWENVRFPEGILHEDAEVLLPVFDLCRNYVFLNRALYYYRIRKDSITQTISRKIMMDYRQVYEHHITFVETHIPEIFDETHLIIAKKRLAIGMLGGYVNGVVSLKDVMDACKDIDTIGLNFRFKMAYQMILHCPWLLKAAYPIYRFIRTFVGM